jgi:hypothetical protein
MSLEDQYAGTPVPVEISTDPNNPVIGRIGRGSNKTGS